MYNAECTIHNAQLTTNRIQNDACINYVEVRRKKSREVG